MNIKFPPILKNVIAVCSFDLEFEIDLKSVVILRETVQPIRETSVGPFWWTWPDQHRDMVTSVKISTFEAAVMLIEELVLAFDEF